MIIYIDVLLALNLYVNYFLIRSAALLLRARLSPRRCLLAAAVGSLSSLLILAPALPSAAVVLIKGAVTVLLTLLAFGRGSGRDTALRTLVMLTVSFVYSGLMLALWSLAAPLGMVCGNGIAYFDIPISAVALLTIAAYCVIRLLRRFADTRISACESAEVTIKCGGGEVRLRGFPDTGNGLCDPFSGKPVIICAANALSGVLPDNVRQYLGGELPDGTGIRLVPCSTVTAQGLIPVFTADSALINGKPADAAIGVSSTAFKADFDCIFNPKILT